MRRSLSAIAVLVLLQANPCWAGTLKYLYGKCAATNRLFSFDLCSDANIGATLPILEADSSGQEKPLNDRVSITVIKDPGGKELSVLFGVVKREISKETDEQYGFAYQGKTLDTVKVPLVGSPEDAAYQGASLEYRFRTRKAVNLGDPGTLHEVVIQCKVVGEYGEPGSSLENPCAF